MPGCREKGEGTEEGAALGAKEQGKTCRGKLEQDPGFSWARWLVMGFSGLGRVKLDYGGRETRVRTLLSHVF